jgi:hypothetical protein
VQNYNIKYNKCQLFSWFFKGLPDIPKPGQQLWGVQGKIGRQVTGAAAQLVGSTINYH